MCVVLYRVQHQAVASKFYDEARRAGAVLALPGCFQRQCMGIEGWKEAGEVVSRIWSTTEQLPAQQGSCRPMGARPCTTPDSLTLKRVLHSFFAASTPTPKLLQRQRQGPSSSSTTPHQQRMRSLL